MAASPAGCLTRWTNGDLGAVPAPAGDHVERAFRRVIAIGDDTDTVAAIAGALLGARYGVSGLPSDWARQVHGWPDGTRARGLVRLGLATANGGILESWPGPGSMITGNSRRLAVTHPDDPQVILGTEADLAHCGELGVTAVVSLSRVGEADIAAAGVAPGNHVEVWLIDSEDPRQNANPGWTILDAARTVQHLRSRGERVLVHCVAANHRTPAVALACSRLHGTSVDRAQRAIEAAIGHRCAGLLWDSASRQPLG